MMAQPRLDLVVVSLSQASPNGTVLSSTTIYQDITSQSLTGLTATQPLSIIFAENLDHDEATTNFYGEQIYASKLSTHQTADFCGLEVESEMVQGTIAGDLLGAEIICFLDAGTVNGTSGLLGLNVGVIVSGELEEQLEWDRCNCWSWGNWHFRVSLHRRFWC